MTAKGYAYDDEEQSGQCASQKKKERRKHEDIERGMQDKVNQTMKGYFSCA
jgi:hypothetical protein